MKTDGNGRENSLTVFTFIFSLPDEKENGIGGNGKKQKWSDIIGGSKTNQSDRENTGIGRDSKTQNGNTDLQNHQDMSTCISLTLSSDNTELISLMNQSNQQVALK
jgi:hypothetical protein